MVLVDPLVQEEAQGAEVPVGRFHRVVPLAVGMGDSPLMRRKRQHDPAVTGVVLPAVG